jgi:hypothetical protein
MTTAHSTSIQYSIRDFLSHDSISIEEIPETLIQFCWRSIEIKRGEILFTDPDITKHFTMNESNCQESFLELGTVDESNIIELTPSPSTRTVAAIDTSTIKLGDLPDGTLCALRGAIVILHHKRYRYVRYGPLIFSLKNYLTMDEIARLGVTTFSGATNVDFNLRRVRNSLERWLQLSISNSITNGLILIDGSLTAGTPDNPSNEMENILQKARRAENLVIAISKNTQLRINAKSITSLLKEDSKPCLLDVDEKVKSQFPAYPIHFLGRVYVGKLARPGFPFRIDVDRETSIDASIRGLRQLAGTDIVDQGYPETLRVAHILSTFTAGDVLAIQSLAAARFGVQLIPRFALRRSLFGPFGTGWETRH